MAELTEEQCYACPVEGCSSVCFDDPHFAKYWGCAKHGEMTLMVRQFEGEKLVSQFHAQLDPINQ